MDTQTWALDPLFSSFRHLLIATIKTEVEVIEREGKYEFYVCNRPLRKVFLAGTVIDLRLKTTRDGTIKAVLKLDDGTGVIECWKYNNSVESSPAAMGFKLGDYVLGNGVLCLHNGQFMVQLASAEVSNDVNMEALHNIRTIHLYKSSYSQAVVISGVSSSDHELLSSIPPIVESDLLFSNPQNSSRNYFGCGCASRAGESCDKILFIQKNFLYCSCLAPHHAIDPAGIARGFLLHSLSVVLDSKMAVLLESSSTCLHSVGDDVVLRTDDLLEDDMLLSYSFFSELSTFLHHRDVYGGGGSKPQRRILLTDEDKAKAKDMLWTLLGCLHAEGVISCSSHRGERFQPCAAKKWEQEARALTLFSVDVLDESIVKPLLREYLEIKKIRLCDMDCASQSQEYLIFASRRVHELYPGSRIPSWKLKHRFGVVLQSKRPAVS